MDIRRDNGSNMTRTKNENIEKVRAYFNKDGTRTILGCSRNLKIHYNTVRTHVNWIEMQARLDELKALFPKWFINDNNEIILQKKNNIYFKLEDVKSKLNLDCKVLEFLSRPSTKGVSERDQKYFAKRLNSYFGKKWTHEELSKIYTYIGCGCNRKLCVKFIKSGFDFTTIYKYSEENRRGK